MLCAVLYFRSCAWWVSIELTRIPWVSLYVYSIVARAWEIEFSKEHDKSDWWQRERTLENKSFGVSFLCCRRRTLLWPVSIHLANRIVEAKSHVAFSLVELHHSCSWKVGDSSLLGFYALPTAEELPMFRRIGYSFPEFYFRDCLLKEQHKRCFRKY